MNHEEVLLALDEVIATVFKAFKVIGFSDQQAFDVTRQLMYGEIRGGKRNHALDRFAWISKQKDKTFFLDKKIVVESFDSDSNSIILDGKHGVGYSHIYEAIVCALELLKYKNSVIIGLKNTYPTNCLGDYSSIFAHHGYASYVGSLSPDKVAFPNDGVAVLPTSGQAFGMPGNPPMILDFSIGAITNGDLNYHKKHQLKLPDGVCLDKDGKTTDDVNKVVDDQGKLIGIILPRGSESASYIMAGFGVMLMMTGIEVGIKPNTHGTFLSVRKVSPLFHTHWDELLIKLTNKDGQSMMPGHRGLRLANKVISKRKIMIDIKKWQPLLDASSKYQHESQEQNIDEITQSIIDQLEGNYYSSLNNETENKYSNFFK
jgi:LDH2 family malate/lactate/ureidoglycolate dehydrogenase